VVQGKLYTHHTSLISASDGWQLIQPSASKLERDHYRKGKHMNMDVKIPLDIAMSMMHDAGGQIVFLAAESTRTASRTPLTALEAVKRYKEVMVTRVWPNITEGGKYIGNVYVCPELAVPKEFITNPNPFSPLGFTWRAGDTAYAIKKQGEIIGVKIKGIRSTSKPVKVLVGFTAYAHEERIEVSPDVLFRSLKDAQKALNGKQCLEENHAQTEQSLYEVTVTRTGTVQVRANSEEEAAKFAERLPAGAISWTEFNTTHVQTLSPSGDSH